MILSCSTCSGELRTLSESGVTSIGVDYKTDHKRDRYGNECFYRSEAVVTRGNSVKAIKTYDVVFKPAPSPIP